MPPALLIGFIIMVLILAGLLVWIPLLIMIFAQKEETIKVARGCVIVSLTLVASVILLGLGRSCTMNRKARTYTDKLKSYVPQDVRCQIPPQFYADGGAYDFLRFALVYPYEVRMVDTTDSGELSRFMGEDPEIGGRLTNLAFDGSLLIGRVLYRDVWGEKPSETFWIVFEFSSGGYERYNTEAEAVAEAQRRGFSGQVVLEDLNTHYGRFVGRRK